MFRGSLWGGWPHAGRKLAEKWLRRRKCGCIIIYIEAGGAPPIVLAWGGGGWAYPQISEDKEATISAKINRENCGAVRMVKGCSVARMLSVRLSTTNR